LKKKKKEKLEKDKKKFEKTKRKKTKKKEKVTKKNRKESPWITMVIQVKYVWNSDSPTLMF